MSPVRMGIIGCGFIGRQHLQAAAADEGIETVAVADLDTSAAESAAAEFKVPAVYDGAEKLLADPDVDAVVLALITSVRTPVALQALERGKHVLLEKPPAMNAGELRCMQAAQDDRVIACCSSRLSFQDNVQRAAQVVGSGQLGEIRVVHCRGVSAAAPPRPDWTPPPWRVSHRLNGGGFMVNWGVYDLDYLMHATAWTLKPRTVLAQTWPIAPGLAAGRVDPDSDAENHVMSMIRCENGALIVHERGEAISAPDEEFWRICGEQGTLRSVPIPPAEGPGLILDRVDARNGLTSEVLIGEPAPVNVHAMPISDFAGAIREGRAPVTGIERALVIQQMIDAIYESVRTGTTVEITE